MTQSPPTMAQQLAKSAHALQRERTGQPAKSVSVVVGGDTLVITVHEALSPAEKALAKTAAGAAQVQEFHRRLFDASFDQLRQEIRRVAGMEVREAATQVEPATGAVVHAFTTGNMVHVVQLAGSLPTESWTEVATDGT